MSSYSIAAKVNGCLNAGCSVSYRSVEFGSYSSRDYDEMEVYTYRGADIACAHKKDGEYKAFQVVNSALYCSITQ